MDMTGTAPAELSCFARSESLLKSTADLLDLHLELWADGPFPLVSCRPYAACQACERRTPGPFRRCSTARGRAARAAASRAEVVTWTCAHGLSIRAFPIPGREAAGGGLVAVNGAPVDAAKRAFLEDLARLLSDQLLLHREMSSLNGELSARYDELHMLYNIAGRLTSEEDLRQALRMMLAQTREAVEADAALLFVRDGKIREAIVRPHAGIPEDEPARTWSRLAQTLHRRIEEGGRRYFVGRPWAAPDDPAPFRPETQALAVSVLRKGGLQGILALLHFGPGRDFRSSDIKLLESLSEQVSLAVVNSELYEDLKDFLMATVKSLVGAIEAKDSYTSGHSERVNLVSMLIGKQLELPPSEMETLRWASILHDVGKIGMPEAILRKPGRLTDEEYEIIKLHPERGYQLLSPIRQLAAAAVHVRAHHEKFDGRGYPDGLRGEAIPRLARIIAVADTYDALTSTRSYRSARTLDFALGEIRRAAGTQLDQEAVEAFSGLVPFLREHGIMINEDPELEQVESGAGEDTRAA